MTRILTTFLVLGACLGSIQAIHNGASTIGQLLDAITLNLSVFEDRYHKLKNQSSTIAEEGHRNALNVLENILGKLVDSFSIVEGLEATAELRDEADQLGLDITSCNTKVNFESEQLHEIADTIAHLNKIYVLHINKWNKAINDDVESLKTDLQKFQNESRQCLKNLENTSIAKVCLLQVLSQLSLAVAHADTHAKIVLNDAIVNMEQMKAELKKIYWQHVNKWPEQLDYMADYFSECVEDIYNSIYRNQTVTGNYED